MRTRGLLIVAMIGLAVALIWSGAQPLQGQAPASAALSGQVSSTEEGPMEGVVVSARKTGGNITVSVVSDQQGRYSFPANRLEPGPHAISIKAVGYDLDGGNTVDVVAQKNTTLDLKLRKTTNLVSQLSNSEFIQSFPGTPEQKISIRGCTHCHTLERIVRSTHDVDEFEQVVTRMTKHTPESFPLMIQPPNRGRRIGGGDLSDAQAQRQFENRQGLAKYLATLNLSAGEKWEYEFKPMDRPKGRSTRVIYTEYHLPRVTRQPHDVIVDSQGFAWYASFGEPILSKIDPKTGKITEYAVPVLKPGYIFGTLDIEFDKEENVWLAMTFQGGIAKFDRKTEKFQVFNLPPELNGDYRELTFLAPQNSHIDGKVWINDSGSWTQLRLDIASGKFEVFEPFKVPRPNTYQMASDSQNNGWFFVFGKENIGRIDAKTGQIKIFDLPTVRSSPRRGMIDKQDRVWMAQNRSNKIAMFDPKTEKFKEWDATELFLPYDVTIDKNDEAWAVTEFKDRVLRLDTKTGQSLEYQLPRHTNMRRAWVDNSTSPVTFWVGNTHSASVVRVEPLD